MADHEQQAPAPEEPEADEILTPTTVEPEDENELMTAAGYRKVHGAWRR